MDREQLMGHGYTVERGLLQALRSELGELLVAGRKAFELPKDGRLRSLSGGATTRMRGRGPGPGCMLSTRAWASWARGGSAKISFGVSTAVYSARAGDRPGGRGGQGWA